MNPKISIVTPNFNKGEVVRECISSVHSQSFQNWELHFIDDGSTDGSFEAAIEAANGDERILFSKNTTGIKGANAARNQGIENVKSEFVIFLDSDDLMTPNCLEQRLNDFARYPDLDFITYPMGLFINEIGDSEFISNIPTEKSDLHRFLDRDIVWLISGPTWKKSALESLGCFDLNLQSQQDYDLHVRSLIKGLKYKYIHRIPDIYYRREVDSVPRRTSQSLDHFRQRFNMILHHEEMLREEGILNEKERLLLARYILDLAQMMRWHIADLGRKAQTEALAMWEKAYELKLVSKDRYGVGITYIRFKHNMTFNRLGFLQRYLEKNFRKHLGDLIFHPSTTYCQVTMADYDE